MPNFLYRDSNSDLKASEIYKRGIKLYEPGFVDTTMLQAKPLGKTRFIFFSSRAKDIRTINPNAKQWGMAVFDKGTEFGVVDVFAVGGTTQVLLITDAMSTYKPLILAARNDLQKALELAVEPALDEEWQKRTATFVGVDDRGRLFTKPDVNK